MNIKWNVSQTDIAKIEKLISDNQNAFLETRRLRNVEKENSDFDKNSIVKTMIMCLLTSQQRSGPNSVVGQFLRSEPFPITIEKLAITEDVENFIKRILQQARLTRYVNRISSYFCQNYKKIIADNWSLINELNELRSTDSKTKEREVADRIANNYEGFGPKQARNFLQALGMTKYEIPIDSRITTWLNDFGFSITLTSSPLGDNGYYHFVSDGIQELCEKAKVYPCILDAAIFSSFDNNEWTDGNIIF